MVVENKVEKLCCFYVSDFHLEMILLPYINKKIDEKIVIKTEKDLKDTVESLVSKMNLDIEKKEKILSLGWNGQNNKEIEDKSNIIIIGNQKYINNINSEIKERKIKDITIIDCYNFEDTKDEMDNIISNYRMNLNTTGLETMKY